MIEVSAIGRCYKRRYRGLGQSVAMLVAYSMAIHQILLAFAVTAMALWVQKPSDSLFMQSASARQFIMVLCRPGAMWTDSTDDTTPSHVAHLKGCCGISAIQSAGLLDVPHTYTALSLDAPGAYISWFYNQAQKPEFYRFVPAARGPPIA